jgi:hypothetical protein
VTELRIIALLDPVMILLNGIIADIDPETVIKTVCGRDAAVELIEIY